MFCISLNRTCGERLVMTTSHSNSLCYFIFQFEYGTTKWLFTDVDNLRHSFGILTRFKLCFTPHV